MSKPWVVYAKTPLGGPAQVLEYLSRYTHKTAISNERIKAVSLTEVTFTARAKNEGGKRRITLPTPAFRDMVNSQRDRAAASVSSPTQPRAAAPPAPPSQPPQPAAGYVDPVTVRDPAKRVPPRTGSLSDARVPTTTYVNSVSVFVATNPDNDRVALMMCGRFLPDSKKASDEYNGRTVERWSVYDSVLSASSDTVGAMAPNSIATQANQTQRLAMAPQWVTALP